MEGAKECRGQQDTTLHGTNCAHFRTAVDATLILALANEMKLRNIINHSFGKNHITFVDTISSKNQKKITNEYKDVLGTLLR